MSEWLLGSVGTLKLLLIAGFATLYWIGGRRQKAWRRIGGAAWLSLGVCGFALFQHVFHWWMLLAWPAYTLALSVGYGADTIGAKLKRRAMYGLLLGACSGWFLGSLTLGWLLFAAQIVLAVFAGLVFGVVNPLPAVEEETVIATLSVVLVPFML